MSSMSASTHAAPQTANMYPSSITSSSSNPNSLNEGGSTSTNTSSAATSAPSSPGTSSSAPHTGLTPHKSERKSGFLALPGEQMMTWYEICQTIATGDLDDLKRAPRCQARYDAWAAGVRKEWGGLEAFVRAKRLGWPEDPPVAAPLAGPSSSSSSASGSASSSAPALTPARREWPEKSIQHLDGSGRELRHFVDGLPDELAKCIPNDWPYGIPFGCEHYVVWSQLPILHSSLFTTDDTPFPSVGGTRDALYQSVASDGVRGLTGAGPDAPRVYGTLPRDSMPSTALPSIPSSGSSSTLPNGGSGPAENTEHSLETIAQAQEWAGREVRKFVTRRWPEEDWMTAWFCNPPHLRTVPGLSHFHVITKPKRHVGAGGGGGVGAGIRLADFV